MSDIFDTQKSDGNIPSPNLDDARMTAKTSDGFGSTNNQTVKTTTHVVRDKTQSAHSTGVGDHGRWSTQRIAVYALFSAVAMAASYISISLIPGYTWLTYDPSGIICMIAGFAFGPSAAVIVSVLCWVPHIFTDMSGILGALVAIVVSLAMSVPGAYIYSRDRTRRGALIGIVVSSMIMLVAAIGCNLLITPIYTGWSEAQVLKIIVPALLPFNIVKLVINDVVTFLVYKPISNLLNR
jgi:riboflavin transporter